MSRRRGGLTRRQFVAAGTAAGAGLAAGCLPGRRPGLAVPAAAPAGAAADSTFTPNAWVRVGTDGVVTIVVDRSELGQGAMTALPMLVAEELEVDIGTVRVVMAPAAPQYANPLAGRQITGGSTAVRAAWLPLRRAGAAAREMLVGAAAVTWNVEAAQCRAERGTVVHVPTGRRLSYGQLAVRAAQLPVPADPQLKAPDEWRVIGTSVPRLDAAAKLDGSAVFGLDVRVPGMLVAAIARCPVFGGRVARHDAAAARAAAGVREVVDLGNAVAVVADSSWHALRARDLLAVTWDEGARAGLSTEGIRDSYSAAAAQPAPVARTEGDVEAALAGAARRVEAIYDLPYLAHATMEPMNCTAHVRADRCDVWVPTQHQTAVQDAAMAIARLPREAVHVHTTLVGGGFGRRLEWDYAVEAVRLSQQVGAPVQVVWSREDDIRHDFYRPATHHRLAAGLDADGWPVAWSHRIIGPSVAARWRSRDFDGSVDEGEVLGAADLPYAVPAVRVEWRWQETGIPVGYWRSVAHSGNGFVTEAFLDEVAAAGGKDPVELRRRLLTGRPRHLGVLDLAVERSGWGTSLGPGRGRGIALHACFGSIVAHVAELTALDGGQVRVDRVVCVVDCGTVVNPDLVRSQMEGAVAFALSAVLHGEITIVGGRVRQAGFSDYPVLRMSEMPPVEVHIVPSRESPGGIGEVGVPTVAPAVANAFWAATGRRIRRPPLEPLAPVGSRT